MTIQYTIFRSETEGEGATLIFSDSNVVSIDSHNPNYEKVVELLRDSRGEGLDEEQILSLIIPAISAGVNLRRLSERVTFDGRNIFFDGDLIDNSIANHIIRIIDEGGTENAYSALVAFLEKLYQNPSDASRQSLYDFIVRYGITIDNDGDIYLYKGVNSDGTSINRGFGIVNGKTMNGNLPNSQGAVIEIPRSKVDADNSVGCSTGLHAGSYAYASGFSRGKLLTVKINPRDVVSVPDDCSYQKVRVSRYKVTGIADHQIQSTTFTYGDDDVDNNTITALETLLEYNTSVNVTFNYSRGDGTQTSVDADVYEIRSTSDNNLLLVTRNEEDAVRSYRWDRISDFEIDPELVSEWFDDIDDDDDDDDIDDDDIDDDDIDVTINHSVVDFKTAAEKDRFSGSISINTAPVATPIVPANRPERVVFGEVRITTDELVDYLTDNEVVIDFDYTTVSGESRSLRKFLATETRNGLVFGIRNEDSEVRSYRLDRIYNLKIEAS